MNKIELSRQAREFLEIYGSNVNKKYYFFPKVYLKGDDYEYKELEMKDLPEGVKKYILDKINEK